MSSQSENEMSDLEAENYTQTYPVVPWWVKLKELDLEIESLLHEN